MTEKGYDFLCGLDPEFLSIFTLIVVGSDKSLKNDYEFELIEFCQKNNLEFTKRSDFKNIKTEYAMAISWRWLIDHPQDKLIIFHDSLLPKYRGFAPLINSLIKGETEVGVTAIFGADEFDTGPIIFQSKSTIKYPIKIIDAIQINNKNYINCAKYVISMLINERPLEAISQNELAATYSVWRDEEDYRIDWSQSSSEICRLVDAVGYPYQGAFTMLDGQKIRILAVQEVLDVEIENRHYGKALFVVEGMPVVICGKGMIKITEAHIESGGKIDSILPIKRYRLRFTN